MSDSYIIPRVELEPAPFGWWLRYWPGWEPRPYWGGRMAQPRQQRGWRPTRRWAERVARRFVERKQRQAERVERRAAQARVVQ